MQIVRRLMIIWKRYIYCGIKLQYFIILSQNLRLKVSFNFINTVWLQFTMFLCFFVLQFNTVWLQFNINMLQSEIGECLGNFYIKFLNDHQFYLKNDKNGRSGNLPRKVVTERILRWRAASTHIGRGLIRGQVFIDPWNGLWFYYNFLCWIFSEFAIHEGERWIMEC